MVLHPHFFLFTPWKFFKHEVHEHVYSWKRQTDHPQSGPPYLENGAVCIDGTKIKEVGETAALRARYPEAEFIDARGGVIMPAFINAHTHIYSALARGLSIKGNNPTNFYEVPRRYLVGY